MRPFKIIIVSLCLVLINADITVVPSVVPPPEDLETMSECSLCVGFASQTLNILINYIANAGIIGGCADLCSGIENTLEKIACNVYCDYYGLKAFVEIIDYLDPDPIHFCEMLKSCPVVDGGAAQITESTVEPQKASLGTVFDIIMEFEVTSQTGTGQIVVEVIPPADMSFGGSYLNTGFVPGNYSISFSVDSSATDENGFPMSLGLYEVKLALCEGTCGSKKKHSAVLSTSSTSFTIN